MLGFFLTNIGAKPQLTKPTIVLMVIVMASLFIAQVVGYFLRRQPDTTWNPAVIKAFHLRLRSYWMMATILIATFLFPYFWVSVLLFFGVSFWALREFITLTPTRIGDHRALFWVFFVLAPAHFFLVTRLPRSYDLFVIAVPVFGFLFIPARIALAGDPKRFLERAAKIQAGLLICVYCLSYAPALLYLSLKNAAGGNQGLLFYFILVVQLGDLFQYAWGQFLGKRVIAPEVHAGRTWEGCIGGVITTTMVGTLLWWVTPFHPWEAAGMSAVIAIMGFAGTMTLSAIKRDRGVRDYGTLVRGHAGVLDRIDSICFAAPVFYHLTRVFFTQEP